MGISNHLKGCDDGGFFKINRAMIPIKVIFLLCNVALMMPMGFFNLQAVNIGLSVGDVGVVSIVVSAVSLVINPLIGYSADIFGYKLIIIATGSLIAIAATLIDQTPRYREYHNHPYIKIATDNTLVSFNTPLCYNDTICQEDPSILQWLTNDTIQKHVGNCKDSSNQKVDPQSVIWPGLNDPYSLFNTTVNPNGTFCVIKYSNVRSEGEITCDVLDTSDGILPSCVLTQGNHSLTFAIFTVFTVLCRVPLNNFFSLLDSTAMQYAKKYDGSYAMCILFNSAGVFIASYFAAALIVDPKDGVGEVYYQNMYYTMDAVLAVLFVVVILKIQVSPSSDAKASLPRVMRKLSSPIFALFMLYLTIYGILYSVLLYVTIFAQTELGASSEIIAVANGLQYGVGIFIAPFADFIIDRLISPFNVLTVSLFIFGIRLYFYATVFMDPPYQIIILTLFDMLNATLSWIATLKFAFNITPHENFAIVVTMISAVQFTCGNGIGSLIWSELLDSWGLSYPQLFAYTGIASVVFSLVFAVNYYIWGKRNELSVMEKLNHNKSDPSVGEKKVENLQTTSQLQVVGTKRF